MQIQQLDDQALKYLELQFKDLQGRELGASIELEAQIVLNKHQYLQTQLQKFDQKIFTLENDLNEYRTDLDVIERPFKIKLFKEQSFKQQQNEVFEQFDQHPQMNKGDQLNPNKLQTPEHREQIPSVLQSEKHLEQFEETPDAPEILQHGVIIFSLYGLITLFVCSAKPSFLDVLVCHGLMFTIFMDMFETFHLKLVGVGLVASIFYDILWMKQYNFWWFSDDQNNPEWGLKAQTLLRFVLILTYIQFLYKFVVCYYIYQFHRESIDSTKRYSFTIWGIQYKVGRNRNSSYWKSQ
ncbi:unnamed protein product (macronuclear) [Paramecium tetraurelia]|uniref:Transmembrane protein n=1 Tax=Paramecium tetraurelia TaxID=5888 RepID=A0CQJ1_PARTE|nr:uncharacterized protein GSPATT00009406001 [Paramecium tetraurelia]CAK73058.1 unnamed protein product [Paramecium tetraurelia]|eukprot:XP_001440455.1 hypothetical protein (macronuclear) [Paramecium tetraurelia strain d4-2]